MIELLDTNTILTGLRFPYKVSKVTQVVISKGEISCIVDFFSYALKAPSMAIFFPGQVIESLEASDDFDGFGMVTTEAFRKGSLISQTTSMLSIRRALMPSPIVTEWSKAS